MSFDPSKFVLTLNDNMAMIDFYDEHQVLCEDAFVFETAVKDKAVDLITPQFKAAIRGLKKPFECMAEAQQEALIASGDEYLTYPELNYEQAAILGNSALGLMGSDNLSVRCIIYKMLAGAPGEENARSFFDKLQERGFVVDRNFFIGHVAERTDPQTGARTEVSLSEALEGASGVTLRERTQDEIWHIRNINKAYERQYLELWQSDFKTRTGAARFDIEQIKEANKGSFFERFLRRTSREYKNFIKALEDYNNPESKDYLNKSELRAAANAYKEHKHAQGRPFERMDATSKGRYTLAENVIKSLDEFEEKNDIYKRLVEEKLYPGINAPVGEQFLKGEDIENAVDNQKVAEKNAPVKEQSEPVIDPKAVDDKVADNIAPQENVNDEIVKNAEDPVVGGDDDFNLM